MSAFEKLVRPFQAKNTKPPRYKPTSEKPPNENMVLSIGGGGEVKTYQNSYSLSVTRYMTKQDRELIKFNST
jgi:hypothetical protein